MEVSMNASLKLPIFAFAFALTTMVEGANAHEEDADAGSRQPRRFQQCLEHVGG